MCELYFEIQNLVMYFILLGENLYQLSMANEKVELLERNNSILSKKHKKTKRFALLFRLKYIVQARKCVAKLLKAASEYYYKPVTISRQNNYSYESCIIY